uniref:Uncharacterized protein n=1 Tax=Clytia hemisphaerica TaxID=252671 RepID=A0A7M5UFT5_9CNID|eukprot:TCONS_00027254-protein
MSTKVIRSSDLCRTTSPKMQLKNKKRRKSSSSKPVSPQEKTAEPKYELGLNFNNNNNNNNSIDNNNLTTDKKLPRKFTNPKRKVSTTPKLENLSLSDSSEGSSNEKE